MTLPCRTLSLLLLTWTIAKAETQLACGSAKPVAEIGEHLALSAWVEPGSAATYVWSTATGKIKRGVRGKATWDLTNVDTGPAKATVEVHRKDAEPVACTIQIRVVTELGGGSRGFKDSVRTLLESGKSEAEGFGLYSYVLFGSEPENAAEKERYKQILGACLRLLRNSTELVTYIAPKSLNTVYLPVKDAPPDKADESWVLEHYDYSRARALLIQAPVTNKGGVYIVSASLPLLGKTNSGQYLVQDLTRVPGNLASTWVDVFISQAAQDKYWEPNTAAQLVLKMRLALSVLSVGVPQVKQAVSAWISMKG